MVRIIELTEAEDLKPLKAGTSSHISGVEPDVNTLKTLNKINQHYDTYKSASLDSWSDHKWEDGKTIPKTQDDKEAEQQQLRLSKNEMNSRSLEFIKDLKQAIPYIEKNCSKYLPIFHNAGFLYRGFNVNDLPHAVFYGYPRANRRPRDSSAKLQEDFDAFLAKLGISARRNNSLFCTGKKETAEGYGLPFIIIPCNDAEYAWSRIYEDIILDQGNMPKFVQLINSGAHPSYEKSQEEFQKIFEIEKSNNMEEAIKTHHEVWVYGHYIAILATLEPQLRKLLFG